MRVDRKVRLELLEYRKLLEEIVPAQISHSALHSVCKMLLSERVSVRNVQSILEAVAEVAAHMRRPEQMCEHVRLRLAQQICGDIADDGELRVLRLGAHWESAFQKALRRDARGEIIEFDLEQKSIEEFCAQATKSIQALLDKAEAFALVTSPEARPYVRMIMDRLFPSVAVLSHMEVARAVRLKQLGAIS